MQLAGVQVRFRPGSDQGPTGSDRGATGAPLGSDCGLDVRAALPVRVMRHCMPDLCNNLLTLCSCLLALHSAAVKQAALGHLDGNLHCSTHSIASYCHCCWSCCCCCCRCSCSGAYLKAWPLCTLVVIVSFLSTMLAFAAVLTAAADGPFLTT